MIQPISIIRRIGLIFLLFLQAPVFSQSYQLTALSGVFTPISGGTNVPSLQADDAISDPIDIGFNFIFNGTGYTQIRACSNGFISFNASSTNSLNNDLTGTTDRPLIAPLWDDIDGSAGYASYAISGTSPNRVFTFEWLNWKWNYSASSAVISFQVKLHETINQIDFVYKQEAGTVAAPSASIGLALPTSGFYSLSDASSTPSLSTSSETKTIATKPATGQIYCFTYVLPEPTNHATSFSASTNANNINLSWIDATGVVIPSGYLIKASTTNSFTDPVDGVELSIDNDLSDNIGVIHTANGIQSFSNWTNTRLNTTYYFQIYPYTNSGSYINYKTDGTVPQASGTTPFFTTIASSIAVQGTTVYGDFTNDGKLDAAVIGTSSLRANISENIGSNSFSPIVAPMPNLSNGSLAWGDYDNDGYLDLFVTGTTGVNDYTNASSTLYHNNGDKTFTIAPNTSFSAVYQGACAFGDYDKDGFLDIIIIGKTTTSEDIARIYHNTGHGTFNLQMGIVLPEIEGSTTFDARAIWADFNNDGSLDLLLNSTSSTYLYTYNIKNNTFDIVQSFQLRTGYSGFAFIDIGDYNNDGYLDILKTGCDWNGGYAIIYKNNGDLTFSTPYNLNDNAYHKSAFWADYDNDGYLDAMVDGKVYKNSGDETFALQSGISLGTAPVTFADFDSDGDLDFMDASHTLYKNNITTRLPSLSAPENLTSVVSKDSTVISWKRDADKNTRYAIRVTDINGNDLVSPQALPSGTRLLPDYLNLQKDTLFVLKNLVIGDYTWTVQKVNQNGIGSPFAAEQSFTLPFIQSSHIASQFITSSSMRLKWKRGTGAGCVVFAKEGINGAATPIDEIQYLDIPVLNKGSQIGSTGWYCLFDGIDTTVTVSGFVPRTTYTFEVMEYYRENEKNYYKTNSDSANLATFGTSILTERIDFPAVDIGGDLTWADYQNDGLLDFVVSGTNAQITMLYPKTGLYKNNGDNDFNLITSDIPDLESSSSSWGDYNNDGYLDLLVSGDKAFTNYPSTILFKNNQNGTFSEATDVPLIGVNGGSAQWHDFDNDGNLDIIATGLSSDTYDAIDSISYLIYRNNGDNTFSNPIHYRSTFIGTTYVSAEAFCADYNNDGLTDILVKSTYDGIKLFKNLGDFKFEEQANLPINGLNGIVVWGDYDNDGYPDLTISGAQSYLFKNDGKGSFALISDALPIIRKWTDFDNDGYWDFIFSDNSSSGILRNNGNGTFTEQTGIYLPQKDIASIASGDYDNDGDNDLLFSGESSPYVTKLYQNNLLGQGGLIKNSAPQSISGLTARLKPGYTILTWQPGYDNETPTKALTYNLKLWKKDSTNFIVSPNSDPTSGFRQIAQAGNMQMATSYDIRNLKSGTYFWQVQAVDGGFMGGAWSDTSSFIVNAAQAYFTADTVCLGISTSFTDNSYAYDGLIGWKWNFGDTTAYSTLQNPTHIYQFSGEHTVQLIVTNSSGKTDTVYNTILVKPIPIVSFTASNVCIGTTTTIVNETNVASVSSWNWNFGDGQSSIYANPGSHVYSSQGSYTISLFVAASNGCSASENRNIVITTTPNATLSLEYGNPTFCKGDSVVYSVPLNSNYSYHWLRNNDYISETSNSIKVKTESGDYKVIITNNLSNTCSATSDVKTISVNEAPAIPVINPESGTTFCQGDSVKINAGSILGVATWYRNEGTLTSTQNYFVAKETGSYTLKTTFANGCSSKPSLPVDVTVNPNPVLPSVSYGETTICQGSSVNFSTANSSLMTFQWYRNNEIITDATSNLFSANESGDYWLQVSNSNQCKVKTSPVSVMVNELPDKPTIAEANNITNFCLGSEVELVVTNALSDLNYQWKRSGITIDGASLSSYKGKLAAGDYRVEVGQGNCSVESEILTLTTKPAPPKPNIYAWGPNVWIVVCDNTTAVDYRWYYNDQLLVGAKSNQYVAKQNLGDYFVEVNDGGECYTRSDIINIPTGGIVSGVEDLIGDAVTIYPNPTEGIVIVNLGNKLPGELKVEFLNALGSIVVEYRFNDSNGFSVDLARVPNGIYLCKIYYKNSVVAKKIVKQ